MTTHEHQPRRPHRQPHPRHRSPNTRDGTAVCHVGVASGSRCKNAASGGWVDKSAYFDATVFGAEGETAGSLPDRGPSPSQLGGGWGALSIVLPSRHDAVPRLGTCATASRRARVR
jgi:hypothetical protein